MIMLVWSLVSSVVEAARRRRLTAFLAEFLAHANADGLMLVCRHISSAASTSKSSNALTRFSSDPLLHASHSRNVIYRNENTEVTTEISEPLKTSQWRFAKRSVMSPNSSEFRIFFVAQRSLDAASKDNDEFHSVSYYSVFLDSSCERVAWHRFTSASLYVCSMECFFDVVYAFSECALYDNIINARPIDYLHTVRLSYDDISDYVVRPNSPIAGSLTHLNQKPMSLLEQLYMNDVRPWNDIRDRFFSESALHIICQRGFDVLPRRFCRPPRRRYRSHTGEVRNSNALSCLMPGLELQVAQFFRQTHSLPRCFHSLDNTLRITTGLRCDDSFGDISCVDHSEFATSPNSAPKMTSALALVGKEEGDSRDELMSETIGEKPKVEIESSTLKQTILVNGNELSDQAHDKNPLERVKDRVKDRQPIPVYISRPSMAVNSDALEKKATEPLPPGTITKTWRRHSAMDHVRETLRRESSCRVRSVSPMGLGGAARIRHSICEILSGDRPYILSSPYRRHYTPTRRFHITSDRSSRAMCKPPSILVYTGGQDGLYARIRDSLSRLIPADRYTVFHLSPEAMKKQPWMEPSTACLVVADTSELDDQSWANMQLYFNQAGKIIFVCQNQLLASLTHCDSSKKQANMIRMAFGSRDAISMGKDFEHFLKKSLKTLSKHGEINTKFHSKDFAGAMSYSVVFSKVKDMPLFLYMENSAHQASAIFSDATSEQLLSPGNKILPEALSRVGVEVVESTPPALTQAVMMASEDSIIENMMGVRYGEEIGQTPKLFFRRTERAIEQGMPEVSEKLLPVEVLSRNLDHPDIGFDFLLYFTCLQTRQLGHVIVYVPVATTTMDINESLCDAIPTCQGAVVVARRQVNGKGRGGNEFVSPLGAAMFTFSTCIPQSSCLARTPSFIQHIFAVAVVDAVHRLSGLDDFPLRIKWPNDFYFNRSHKVGGLLATAKVRDDGLLISIGAGINVANSRPTVCLNDMVPDGSSIKFSVEEVIAETLNRFEYWLNMCEIKGQAEVLKTYYRFWLHSREEVTIEHLSEKVVIRGLDKCGFLQVRSKSNPSQVFSLGDNGNTFDMMKGLIRYKIR